MKKIYATLMALAAALMLVPVASAQTDDEHEKYIAYPNKKVGLNKYLVSTEPDENGEYTLRLETFLTGSASKLAVPTDFVLVLDCSGSMTYDALYGKQRPESVTAAQLQDKNDPYYNFLHEAHDPDSLVTGVNRYSYSRGFTAGTLGEQMPTTSGSNGRTTWSYFNAATGTSTNSMPSLYYYYAPDQTYYLIHRESSGGYRRIYITTSAGKLYVRCRNVNGSIVTDLVESGPTTGNNHDEKIILIGYKGDNIYRPRARMEALESGVKTFIEEIYTHNTDDKFAEGVKKHQVSIIAFGNGYNSGAAGNSADPSTAVNTNKDSGTRVVKDFAEITSSNKETYKNSLDTYFGYRGSTVVFYGIRLAKRLLQKQEAQSGMAPVNPDSGTNRNKVVVFFTDGEPTATNADATQYGTATTQNGYTQFNNIKLTLNDAKIIKANYSTGSGYTKGCHAKIFTIDLAGSASTSKFLEHLSSNYPEGEATGGTTLATITYSGTQITPASDRIFYMDANAGGLEDAFKAIVDANTGDTSEHMVAVDVINDSFTLPVDITDPGRVKIYTAQCVGVKTIDGAEYLAFTDDVPVGSRDPLEEIWFNGEDEHGEVTWTKMENYDVDANITCSINGKTLIFKGFDFANLWCGTDESNDHNNTQQITEGMKNYAVKDAKYRGFKLVAEFPITVADDAVGGPDVPTNKVDLSGLFPSDADGNPETTPIVNYPEPILTIPIKLVIQKTGLNQGESASFTIERKLASSTTATWTEFTTFVLTGNETATDIPEIRFISLDPRYHYRVKESGWSWAYENADPSFVPSTETGITNPIVFENDPQDGPKHAEAKAVNKMRKTASQTITVYDKTM